MSDREDYLPTAKIINLSAGANWRCEKTEVSTMITVGHTIIIIIIDLDPPSVVWIKND